MVELFCEKVKKLKTVNCFHKTYLQILSMFLVHLYVDDNLASSKTLLVNHLFPSIATRLRTMDRIHHKEHVNFQSYSNSKYERKPEDVYQRKTLGLSDHIRETEKHSLQQSSLTWYLECFLKCCDRFRGEFHQY